jgi:hypothetical protein
LKLESGNEKHVARFESFRVSDQSARRRLESLTTCDPNARLRIESLSIHRESFIVLATRSSTFDDKETPSYMSW